MKTAIDYLQANKLLLEDEINKEEKSLINFIEKETVVISG
jgi:hypothetical protein